jgi:deoxyribodipyrimidine photo-lyase
MKFPTNYSGILERVHAIDPISYAHTRNFIDGAVSYLSPYISRGVLTLPQIKEAVLSRGYKPFQVEKFLQELAWREYYQRIWRHFGNRLFEDIKQPQRKPAHDKMVKAIYDACTGIDSIDSQIRLFYHTGYLHNHVRMYVASIVCNSANASWKPAARWMYYHLLDGDLASNTCSWQWVAGTFSSKRYIANQENINKYLNSEQRNTFLDASYEALSNLAVPETLMETVELEMVTDLPASDKLDFNYAKPLLIYHSYHLNNDWRKEEDANRILLLEPSHFTKYAISSQVIQFVIQLSANIPGIKIFTGEVSDIPGLSSFPAIYTIDHPLTSHYPGLKDSYSWMFPQVMGYQPSFFSFWKKARKFL